jgi:DNA (cytosine-5)-methyltransferase 1
VRYGSVCSGIEAATAAWHHMGWEPAFFSEIEKFPRAVLEHHYPEVPLHGDFTTIEQNQYGKIDLLVGGTPCQSFSVAGLRGGLDDDRGNLALEFCRLAQRERPRWIVWENVPGVLSSSGGRDFGSILGALEDLGYGLAYRVLDAQYFGVAQRRRRVFVVGYLGDWRCAAAVLFERHSMSGHAAPSRKARQDAPGGAASGVEERGGCGRERSAVETYECQGIDASKFGQHVNGGCPNFVPAHAKCLTAGTGQRFDTGTDTFIATFDGAETARTLTRRYDSSPCHDRGPDVVAFTQNTRDEVRYINGSLFAFSSKDYGADATEDCSPTLRAGGSTNSHQNGGVMPAVAFTAPTLTARCDSSPCVDRGPDVVAFGVGESPDVAHCLRSGASRADKHESSTYVASLAVAVRYGEHQQDTLHSENGILNTLPGGNNNNAAHYTKTAIGSTVRRLTPVECERLQGFPDNFTAIPWKKKGPEACPDGPRYKALGNSMAVPVMRWIGERIQMVDDLISLL